MTRMDILAVKIIAHVLSQGHRAAVDNFAGSSPINFGNQLWFPNLQYAPNQFWTDYQLLSQLIS